MHVTKQPIVVNSSVSRVQNEIVANAFVELMMAAVGEFSFDPCVLALGRPMPNDFVSAFLEGANGAYRARRDLPETTPTLRQERSSTGRARRQVREGAVPNRNPIRRIETTLNRPIDAVGGNDVVDDSILGGRFGKPARAALANVHRVSAMSLDEASSTLGIARKGCEIGYGAAKRRDWRRLSAGTEVHMDPVKFAEVPDADREHVRQVGKGISFGATLDDTATTLQRRYRETGRPQAAYFAGRLLVVDDETPTARTAVSAYEARHPSNHPTIRKLEELRSSAGARTAQLRKQQHHMEWKNVPDNAEFLGQKTVFEKVPDTLKGNVRYGGKLPIPLGVDITEHMQNVVDRARRTGRPQAFQHGGRIHVVDANTPTDPAQVRQWMAD